MEQTPASAGRGSLPTTCRDKVRRDDVSFFFSLRFSAFSASLRLVSIPVVASQFVEQKAKRRVVY